MIIRTPDHHLRVFVSSTLKELAEERMAVRQAILKLRLAPVMFESGARPHPPQDLYKSYLSQSQIFIGIYWQSYGWVAPGMTISGLEDEYNLSTEIPSLIYIKNPAPMREPALTSLLDRIRNDNSGSYAYFTTPQELEELVQNDLALLLTERFEAAHYNEEPPGEKKHLPGNIPIPRNQLVGRAKELASACDLLSQEGIALITLTGPGGCGKSRLAIQIGLEMLDRFKDGVYLVRLEHISDPDLVISSITETLGIRENPGGRPLAELLKETLREKHVLLLLDNFEQVVNTAPSIGELLESCPHLKIVVTSRIPLRLRVEKEMPVPPLSVPDNNTSTDLNSLSQYAAVDLFIQRAQAVKPGFALKDSNASAVTGICSRLDGLPLAIELAAARINMLTPDELLARLEHRFDLLRGGMRDLPERQQTLRNTIDWSHNLLNDVEKKLFRRLSIFVGGWTLEAAEAVCDLDGGLVRKLEDTLAALIDNNLVILMPEVGEHSRFGMLSTIHEYASEELAVSGELDQVHRQHAQYFKGFVKIVEPLTRSAERERWQQVLQQDFGNIRKTLEWVSTSRQCIENGQGIVISLGITWVLGGYIAEGLQWCSQILSISDESTPKIVRAGLLMIAGELTWAQGEYLSAVAYLDESLELFRTLEVQTTDDKNAFATAMTVRGLVATSARDLATAKKMLESSIEISSATGNLWLEAIALSWLGDVAQYENDSERALALYNRSIKLARQQGDPWCMMPPLMSAGQIALVHGDLAKARTALLEVETVLRKTSDQWSLSFALNDLGHLALMEEQFNQARDYFLEGLTLANALGNLRVLLIALAGTAALLARRPVGQAVTQQQKACDLDLAARLCGATVPHVDQPGIFIWPDTRKLYEDAFSQARSLIDDELWTKAFGEGQSISIEQAINLATQALRE